MLIINQPKCQLCKVCETVCFQNAINIDTFQINKNCIECYHCVAVCPTGCIQYTEDHEPDLMPESKVDPRELRLLFVNRRSHRIYDEKHISDDTIKNILEVMRFFPSAKNKKNVYVTIVRSASKINSLNQSVIDILNHKFSKSFNALTFIFLVMAYGLKKTRSFFRMKKRFMERQKQFPKLITYNAPCLMIFHAPNNPTGSQLMDCNIWASYTTVYIQSLGLRSCFMGYVVRALNYDKDLALSLGIPRGHVVGSAFIMGYPKMTFKRKAERPPVKVNMVN